MKLNKKGWGMKELIIMSSVLFVFLLVAAYYVYVLYSSSGINKNNPYTSLESQLEIATTKYIDIHNMNSADNNVGGWPVSEMRMFLNDSDDIIKFLSLIIC